MLRRATIYILSTYIIVIASSLASTKAARHLGGLQLARCPSLGKGKKRTWLKTRQAGHSQAKAVALKTLHTRYMLLERQTNIEPGRPAHTDKNREKKYLRDCVNGVRQRSIQYILETKRETTLSL